MPSDLYGLAEVDVDAVAERLAEALSWPFERRESSYLGPYCLLRGPDGGKIQVYYNEDPMHDAALAPPDERLRPPRPDDAGILRRLAPPTSWSDPVGVPGLVQIRRGG